MPIREEPEDREVEVEWIIVATETVINSVSFMPIHQTAEKRLIKWDRREGVEIIGDRNRAILGAPNPIKFYVRVAERK